jgi:hypothetical protein
MEERGEMRVYCDLDTCRYNKNYECYRGTISLDCDGECQDFESLYDDPEWQKPYWKRLLDRDTKQIYRVLFHGKEIEIKGRKFFVDVNSDYATATEETTGLSCGSRCDLEERIDKIIENIAKCNLPPLETLPIGEYDEKTRRVKPKQTEQEGE